MIDMQWHFFVHNYSLLKRHIKTTRDISLFRSYLKEGYVNEKGLAYLLKILLHDIECRKRFRLLDCLKVIKFQVKNRIFKNPNTVDSLFTIFQRYIFHRNENVCSVVNVLIKDKELSQSQIHWLILNFEKSSHIFNRLVRYPVENSLVRKWAEDIYRSKKFPERKSELMSWFISKDFKSVDTNEDAKNILWAIYYAKLSKKEKEKLLIKTLQAQNADVILGGLKIARRIGSKKVINFLVKLEIKNLIKK